MCALVTGVQTCALPILTAAVDSAMQQAVEVIRRRIDEMGTREPTIVRQGSNRIVVQVPGLQNPAALKALLGKTARLDLQKVDVRATPEDMTESRAPIGSAVQPYTDDPRGLGMIAVERPPVVTGVRLIETEGRRGGKEGVSTCRTRGGTRNLK